MGVTTKSYQGALDTEGAARQFEREGGRGGVVANRGLAFPFFN